MGVPMVRTAVLIASLATTCGVGHTPPGQSGQGQGGGGGHGTDTDTDVGVDLDGDGADASVDCDDADPTISPDLPERCNQRDDNCDGLVDMDDHELVGAAGMRFRDADGDGYGDPLEAMWFCSVPETGWAVLGGDCDDEDFAIYPGRGGCGGQGGGGNGGASGGANGSGAGGPQDDTGDAVPEPRCGDGHVDPWAGETCDDGNHVGDDGCSPTCQTERCGDGVRQLHRNEACDDGNLASGDGCSSTCQLERPTTPTCGDHVVAGSEQCDDGNATLGDGCSPVCTWEDFHVQIVGSSISSTDWGGWDWDFLLDTWPDVYVVGRVDGHEVFRSSTAYETLWPTWSTRWAVRVPYGSSLAVEVWDYDDFSNDDYVDTVTFTQMTLAGAANGSPTSGSASLVYQLQLDVDAP